MKNRTSLPLLTTSSAKDYRACPRLYRYRHVDLYRPAQDADAQVFGTLIHSALEMWWKSARYFPGSSDHWLSEALSVLDRDRDPFRRARARAMMAVYHTMWRPMLWAGQPIEVLAVEREFRGPLINPATGAPSKTWERGGKIDAMIRVAGRDLIVEHKHASEDISVGSDYWRRLRLESQVSNYHVGARALGYDPAGVIYDVLAKPAHRPLRATPIEARKYTKATKAAPYSRLYAGQRETDETADEYEARMVESIIASPTDYVAREMVVRLEHEEAAAAANVWQTALQVRDSERRGLWPQNPEACRRFGSTCPFLPVCEGTAQLTDVARYRRAERQHEELSEVDVIDDVDEGKETAA